VDRGRDAGDRVGLSLNDDDFRWGLLCREMSPRGGDRKRMRVELRDGEGFDQLLRRFNKGIERSGIIREHRRGLRFISVQEENRAKRRKAERRRRRNATT
jgi:ribosomal protein S21